MHHVQSISRDKKKKSEPVIWHLVHQAVSHCLGSPVINPIFSLGSKVIRFLNLIWPNTLCNSDHPQELVDVIARVADQTAKDDENVVYIMFPQNGIGNFLRAWHGFANSCDMSCQGMNLRIRAIKLIYESKMTNCYSKYCCPPKLVDQPYQQSDIHNPTNSWPPHQ